jgi:broad specificity polyphosphatase/5'/3'-nucleotidase SurE
MFNCTIDDNYKFLNWAVTDGDGTSAPTMRTLQKRVSSNASVAAVVAPKETYSLTLEKPEGVTSYTVTATPGGVNGSLSNGGTTTVREMDSYQFECAINDVELSTCSSSGLSRNQHSYITLFVTKIT